MSGSRPVTKPRREKRRFCMKSRCAGCMRRLKNAMRSSQSWKTKRESCPGCKSGFADGKARRRRQSKRQKARQKLAEVETCFCAPRPKWPSSFKKRACRKILVCGSVNWPTARREILVAQAELEEKTHALSQQRRVSTKSSAPLNSRGPTAKTQKIGQQRKQRRWRSSKSRA